MMQEPQEVVEETVTIEEDPGTPSSHVSVVTSDDGTTRRTETKVRHKGALHCAAVYICVGGGGGGLILYLNDPKTLKKVHLLLLLGW